MGHRYQFPGRQTPAASASEGATHFEDAEKPNGAPTIAREGVPCPDCFEEHSEPGMSGTMQCGKCGVRFYCLANRKKPSWLVWLPKALMFVLLVVLNFSLVFVLFVIAVMVDLARDARNAVSTLFFDSVYETRQPNHERVLDKLGPLVRDQYRIWLTNKPITFRVPPQAGLHQRPFWMEGLALLFLFFSLVWYSPEARDFLDAVFVDMGWPVALGIVALTGATIGNLIGAFRANWLVPTLGSMLVASLFSVAIYAVYW